MAKFAIVWMWEANYSEKPLIVEAENAEKALAHYRMHSMYGDKFWATAKVFAFPAEDARRWKGNGPFERLVPVHPDGGVPELSSPGQPIVREIAVLPEFGPKLGETRNALLALQMSNEELRKLDGAQVPGSAQERRPVRLSRDNAY